MADAYCPLVQSVGFDAIAVACAARSMVIEFGICASVAAPESCANAGWAHVRFPAASMVVAYCPAVQSVGFAANPEAAVARSTVMPFGTWASVTLPLICAKL